MARRNFETNPVLVKELRGRMRGLRIFVVLTVYLLILGCITGLIYGLYATTARGPGGGVQLLYLGKTVFYTVIGLELFLVSFLAPAFTVGAISGERERKTYELLRTTLLPAHSLALGKLGAGGAYVFLLLVASMPMGGLAFMLGGVELRDLLLALPLLLSTAFASLALGLFFSSLARSVLASTLMTYGTIVLINIGLPALLLVLMTVFGMNQSHTLLRTIGWYALYIALGLSPLSAAAFTAAVLEEGAVWVYRTAIYTGYAATRYITVPSGWLTYTVVWSVVGTVLVFWTIRRLRRRERR